MGSGSVGRSDQRHSRLVGIKTTAPAGRANETFGSLVFNDAEQQKVCRRVNLRCGARLSIPSRSMRRWLMPSPRLPEWAVEHGATHYTHWFQPLTGITAEKHDSFSTRRATAGRARVLGKELIKGEPDASSFPSGGLRSTFRSARLHRVGSDQPDVAAEERRLGDARHSDGVRQLDRRSTDKKTPLLRSMDALSKQAFHPEVVRPGRPTRHDDVRSRAGILPDRSRALSSRPDLINAGRTLLGRRAARVGTEDQYFGAIPTAYSRSWLIAKPNSTRSACR